MPEAQPNQQLLNSEVRVLVQRAGRGSHQRLIRRVFLFERASGLISELETAFIDHEYGFDAYNTQVAVLADLRFFKTWTILKAKQDESWTLPQLRAANNLMPLTEREVKDFGRWCQRCAGSLAEQVQSEPSNVVRLPGDDVVSTKYRNRRLRNVAAYLRWLIVSLSSQNEGTEAGIVATEFRCRRVEKWFDKQLLKDPKAVRPRSLEPEESQALTHVLADETVFPQTDIGTRDRLIFELLQQGLRAGELLKLRVTGVHDAFKIDLGRHIGVVSIERDPNAIDDERWHEPSVKTRPGLLPIPRRLAQALVAYVIDIRRPAVDARLRGKETPFLFVNHTGKHIGQPTSQRNLNRVVAKLKGKHGLPQTLSPHSLRHTHFTELYDDLRAKGRSDDQIRDLLIDRGRWGPNSTMPARYTARALMRESAAFVEDRDSKLHRV